MFKNNFDLFQLFITKRIHVWDENIHFDVIVPTIRELYQDEAVNLIRNFLTCSKEQLAQFNPFQDEDEIDSYHVILTTIFDLAPYAEYREYAARFREGLQKILPGTEFNNTNHTITIAQNVKLNEDICNYVGYILKLSCGEKADAPVMLKTEEERKFYAAQKAAEDKIATIRRQNNSGQTDSLLKSFLFIEYAFPSYSHDYLLDQTMAQIRWLQNYAAGSVSYKVNEKTFAAGNMKKGSKLDFFIK